MTSAEKLPVREKLGYGLGETGISMLYAAVGFYLLWFLVNVAGIGPAEAGLIFLAVRTWDAISDLLMGRFSDRTRTRWGRRRPFILGAALPLGLACAGLWVVPDLDGAHRSLYYLGVFLLYTTAFTAVVIPYAALSAELSDDYDERTSLSGFRIGLGFVGTLVGSAGFIAVADALTGRFGETEGFRLAGLGLAGLCVLVLLTAALSCRERTQCEPRREADAGLARLWSLLRLPAFGWAIGAYLASLLGLDVFMAVFYFHIDDVLTLRDAGALSLAVILVCALAATPLWVHLGRSRGKASAYRDSVWVLSAGLLVLAMLPGGSMVLLLAASALIGLGVSGAQVLLYAMLPDVVEADREDSGAQRAGQYFGLLAFCYTAASGLAVAAVGLILGWSGYVESAGLASESMQQSGLALMSLRWLVGPVSVALLLGSTWFTARLGIDRETHGRRRQRLRTQGD